VVEYAVFDEGEDKLVGVMRGMRRLTHFEGLIRLDYREEGAQEVTASSLLSANQCQPVCS
jgi:hypothetical protein